MWTLLRGPRARIVGYGSHRFGWPAVVQHLRKAANPAGEGLLFDDFVEASFTFQKNRHRITVPHLRPWAGIFHLVGECAVPFFRRHSLPTFFRTPEWRASQKNLRLAICLSRASAESLRPLLPREIPIAVIKHPAEISPLPWSEQEFRRHAPRRLVQVGWYLRNTGAIFQLPGTEEYARYFTKPARAARLAVAAHWRGSKTRIAQAGAECLPRLDDQTYDRWLASSVVFLEYFGLSASNTLLECLARATPLVLNRLPAAEEYLGRDYPLFYERLEDAPKLLTLERILAGHEYLKSRDKSELTLAAFAEHLNRALRGAAGHDGD